MREIYFIAFLVLLMTGCGKTQKTEEKAQPVKVEMVTDFGNIMLQLSDKTPGHRDNFIKLAKDGYFDGILFHRVIQNFGIQSGDPDSRNAKPGEALGNGGPDYRVPAEFDPELFHKRGALNAARDNNPDRASAGSQFFIVQGKIQNDSTLAKAESRINGWLSEAAYLSLPECKPLRDSIWQALENNDDISNAQWTDSLHARAKGYEDYTPYSIPEAHREVYKTIGGAPHLDQNYTVFGEVISGMEIVDSIAAVPTDSLDRPTVDVHIVSVRIIQ